MLTGAAALPRPAQVLSAYIQMASKAHGDAETAVGQLLDLANNDANNVPVLMALAHGFLLLKQTAKARNQLKVSLGIPVATACLLLQHCGAQQNESCSRYKEQLYTAENQRCADVHVCGLLES